MICYLLVVISIAQYIRKEYFYSLLIFFFLLLEGFQVIPLNILTIGFFSGSSIDASLLVFLGLFVLRGNYWIKNAVRKTKFAKAIFIFIFILISNVIYGLLIGYSFGDVFKGARLYIFLLSFLMFTEISEVELIRVLKVLLIITFVQSILFLLQVVTGQTLLQGPKELLVNDLKYTRFYNTPKLLDLSLAITLFWFPFGYSKKIRFVFIFIFVLAVLAPLHRGYMFAWFLTVAIHSLIYNSYTKKIIYVILLGFLLIIILSVEVLRSRVFEAINQLSILSDIFSNRVIYDSNTFLYRVNHLTERLSYINNIPLGWLFGIGLVDEKAPEVLTLPLRYGLPDPISGNIVKVYTPDLVWSMLFLTMGYIGAFFYVNIFIVLARRYSYNTINLNISKVILSLILIGAFSSFTSNTFLQPHFFIPILLLAIIVEKKKIAGKQRLIKYRVT
ncbi:hypothetical protein [Dyadobacter frigoris]|uniref:Oligosaccharide repeat unit polymerase n=1 Tax=Dyadobacter frigoris TaxID=2576211 RepID=A0A4U6D1H4_9BACT|nr:hypothetical protein [Dyadobacter frigoris]TKT87654.1 hypothetical protein FDK13_29145 [Dyadobacter frigoris]